MNFLSMNYRYIFLVLVFAISFCTFNAENPFNNSEENGSNLYDGKLRQLPE